MDQHALQAKLMKQYAPQTSTPVKLPLYFLDKMVKAESVPSGPTGACLANEHSKLIEQNNYVKEENANCNKGTRFLSSKAVALLSQWFQENRDYPYPDEMTTDYLAKQAEISGKQVKKWFANKRVRSQLCCKPMNRNKRVSHSTCLLIS